MKRLFILISLFLLVFCGFGAKTSFSNIAKIMNASSFSLYSSSAIIDDKVKCIFAGVFYINTVSASEIKKCNNTEGKLGESFTINNCNENEILKLQNLTKFKKVKSEKIGEIKVIYAFTNLLNKYTVVDSQKVNLQIAFDGSNLTVGHPLILGSF